MTIPRAGMAAEEAGRFAPARILFVSSEASPLAKTEGLVAVCAALPKKALAAAGTEVQLILPGYPGALAAARGLCPVLARGQVLGSSPVRRWRGCMPDSNVPVWLLGPPRLLDRPGGPYQDADGRDRGDNACGHALFRQVAAGRGAAAPARCEAAQDERARVSAGG